MLTDRNLAFSFEKNIYLVKFHCDYNIFMSFIMQKLTQILNQKEISRGKSILVASSHCTGVLELFSYVLA